MQNNSINIKPLNKNHVTRKYLQWFDDKEIKKFIVNKNYKDLEELKKYVHDVQNDPNSLLLGIFIKKNKHIGNIKFNGLSKNIYKKKKVSLGILIGEKKFRNRGISSDAINLSLNYVQKKYKINSFYLGVDKTNLQALNAYKKCSFRIYKEDKKSFFLKCNLTLLNMSKFSLGTAQFGSKYGINNKIGKLKIIEIKKIIKFAYDSGVRSIDTAFSYGKAEKILGKIGVNNFKITSKLPFIQNGNYNEVNKIVQKTLLNLKVKKLECLLIHSSANLTNNTEVILKKMRMLKEKNKVKFIGVSFTNYKDIYKIVKKFNIDIIQVPYNILDRRIESKKFISLIKKKNIKLQVRSVFLQGLLFKNYTKLSTDFKNIVKRYKNIKKFFSINKKIKLNKALNFVNKNYLASIIIIGVDNLKQLKEISSIKLKINDKYEDIKCDSENLINPSLWKK